MSLRATTTVGSVLKGILAGKSVKTLDRPPVGDELAILKVSAVTWGEFRPRECKAMPATYEPGSCPRAMDGDVLISRANTRELVGAPVMVKGDHPRLLLSDKLLKLVPDESAVDRHYLVRALRAPAAAIHFAKCAGGTSGSMTNITQDNIRSAPLFLPPLHEQRRIAAILDQADALRAQHRQALAELGRLVHAVFVEIFGDVTHGELPWPTTRFESGLAVSFRNGVSPSTQGKVARKVLTLAAVTGREFDPDAWKTGSFKSVAAAAELVNEQDFLICRGNGNLAMVGRGQFPLSPLPEITFPDTIIAARTDPSRINRLYLQTIWNSPFVRRQIEKMARTTNGTFKVNQSMLGEILLPDPPIALQSDFAKRVQSIRQVILSHRAALAESNKLFASLQHRAFTGTL